MNTINEETPNPNPKTTETTDTRPKPAGPKRVIVTDVDISFGSMIGLMIKFSFAAIPAAIFIFLIWSFFGGLFMAFMKM